MFVILDTVYLANAVYECFGGYEMFGPSVLECSWDGFWNDFPPECFPVECEPMNSIENGLIIGKHV